VPESSDMFRSRTMGIDFCHETFMRALFHDTLLHCDREDKLRAEASLLEPPNPAVIDTARGVSKALDEVMQLLNMFSTTMKSERANVPEIEKRILESESRTEHERSHSIGPDSYREDAVPESRRDHDLDNDLSSASDRDNAEAAVESLGTGRSLFPSLVNASSGWVLEHWQ
jgi:hypothetical protein